MKRALLILLVALLFALTSARTVVWTGGAGNSLWNFATNWDGNAVPSKDDDVVLNPVGGATISVSQPAVARSVTIGGGTFRQTLTTLSSLAVGSGGISIKSNGVLQLSGNNDLPVSSEGDVVASAGAYIIFSSGDIQGPGQYVVEIGAYIEFSGSALKLIEGADLSIYGTATIQPTTIQLAKGASVTNGGDTTAVGQITIFSDDSSQASFYSFGNFSYNGQSSTNPLTFRLPTYFAGDLDVVAGRVVIQGYFYSTGTVDLPVGTAVTVESGIETKTFKDIGGSGSLIVNGIADVNGVLAISWVTVADSGSLTLNRTSSTKSLSVAGKLTLLVGVTFSATDVSVVAGTVTGAGELSASGNVEFAVSANGNVNNFLSAKINIAGSGFLTGSVFLLFADAGNLNILSTGTFLITSSASFVKQTGNPVVTNSGAFSVRLAVGSTFHTNVDFLGGGNFSATAGEITFETNKFNSTTINLGASALLLFHTAVVYTGTVSGSGSLNVSALPAPESVFGDVALSYFGVGDGKVRVNSVKVNTLEIYNGGLALSSGTTNTATIFNFYGGGLSGSAKIASSSLVIGGDIPQTIDTVIINTNSLILRAGKPQGTLITSNSAQIISGSSLRW